MAPVFDRETWLDISVNIVPMVIILFFIVFILFYSPWPGNWFMQGVALGLHVIPFVFLALLTYISARIIEG